MISFVSVTSRMVMGSMGWRTKFFHEKNGTHFY